jgi:hypothetical protein
VYDILFKKGVAMETLIIILITLIFGLIFFNIINNKRFSLFSFMLFILLCLFYYFKFSEHLIYTKLSESIDNLNTYCYIFIIITFIIAIVEYYCGYKHISKKININNDNENNTIKEEVFDKKDSIDIYKTYLDMFDEPIAVLYNDEYIINSCMKKVLKYNSNNIEKKKFYSFIHSSDRNSFINNTNIENFRLNIKNKRGLKIAATIIISAAMGALIGAAIGNNNSSRDDDNKRTKKGSMIGAGIGTLGGIVSAASKKGENVEVKAGTSLTIRLVEPMQITPYL